MQQWREQKIDEGVEAGEGGQGRTSCGVKLSEEEKGRR